MTFQEWHATVEMIRALHENRAYLDEIYPRLCPAHRDLMGYRTEIATAYSHWPMAEWLALACVNRA